MQLETKVIQVFSSSDSDYAGKRRTTPTRPRKASSHFDNIAASVVIGLTAWFVVALFCLVTTYIPGMIVPIFAGAFIGLATGLIAYALMKDDPRA